MNYPFVKQCPICEKYFVIEDFSQIGRKYCYECSPQNRGSDYTSLYHSMKHKLIELKGGKCERCGYNKCEDALHFHHLNPEEKSFGLSEKAAHLTWENFLEESKKCQLLCANCHAEVHQQKKEEIPKDSRVFSTKEDVPPEYFNNIKEDNKKYCEICGKEIANKSTYCVNCFNIKNRTVERPSREELKNMIRMKPFTHIAQEYGVSDKAISKWCQVANLPYRKKDINNYTDEEWENL